MSRKKGEKGGTEEMANGDQCILRYIQNLLDDRGAKEVLYNRIWDRFIKPDRIIAIQLVDGLIVVTLETAGPGDPIVFYYAIKVKWIDFVSDESVLASLAGGGVTGLDFSRVVNYLGSS